jgi:hypothetical protein
MQFFTNMKAEKKACDDKPLH